MATVTLTIDTDGNTVLEVNGAQGTQCQDLTANVERLLGTVQSVNHKPEFHDAASESAQVGQF
jgi:hypothetical protein